MLIKDNELISVLKRMNHMLMGVMINYPYYNPKEIAELNSDVCKAISKERMAQLLCDLTDNNGV